MLEDDCVVEVFGYKICSVDLSGYFDQGHKPLRRLLLNPKAVDIDMPNFGNSLSIQYSLGSCGVQAQSNIQVPTDVMAQRAKPQCLAGTFDNTIQLRLCRIVRQHCLRL